VVPLVERTALRNNELSRGIGRVCTDSDNDLIITSLSRSLSLSLSLSPSPLPGAKSPFRGGSWNGRIVLFRDFTGRYVNVVGNGLQFGLLGRNGVESRSAIPQAIYTRDRSSKEEGARECVKSTKRSARRVSRKAQRHSRTFSRDLAARFLSLSLSLSFSLFLSLFRRPIVPRPAVLPLTGGNAKNAFALPRCRAGEGDRRG